MTRKIRRLIIRQQIFLIMETEFTIDLLKLLRKYNMLNDNLTKAIDNFERNEKIKIEYEDITKSGTSGKEALNNLSRKYFCSSKNIEAIIYHKKDN